MDSADSTNGSACNTDIKAALAPLWRFLAAVSKTETTGRPNRPKSLQVPNMDMARSLSPSLRFLNPLSNSSNMLFAIKRCNFPRCPRLSAISFNKLKAPTRTPASESRRQSESPWINLTTAHGFLRSNAQMNLTHASNDLSAACISSFTLQGTLK